MFGVVGFRGLGFREVRDPRSDSQAKSSGAFQPGFRVLGFRGLGFRVCL